MKTGHCFSRVFFNPDYSGWIASTGHTSAQAPHSVQISGSILYLSPSEIASTGHSSMQVPQAVQSSFILYAMTY
jgi:hypothetical protein